MLNAEKYRNQILEILNTHNDFAITKADKRIRACAGTNCSECLLNVKGISCTVAMIKWLLSDECKESIKLSKLEYELLRHLYKKDYRYIVREKSERMFAYKGRPFKVFGHSWNMGHGEKLVFLNLYDFSYLFQFVNWEDEQPTSIKDVLNNCEVVDDESK